MMTAQQQMEKYRAKHPKFVAKEREKARLEMRKRRENPVYRAKCVEESRKWRKLLREEIFTHYSNGKPKCAKCGYSDSRALCLDHMNNDGAAHRKSLVKNSYRGGNAVAVYVDVKRRGFPDGFQVLCHNCNRIKEVERNVKY